jgi:hypothetical protein
VNDHISGCGTPILRAAASILVALGPAAPPWGEHGAHDQRQTATNNC